MSQTREQLEEMTKPELIEVAKERGLTVDPQGKKGNIVDALLSGQNMTVDPEAKKKMVEGKDIPLGALYDLQGNRIKGWLYELEIMDSEQDHSPVPIIVNGHNIIVQRGKKVIVQEAYIEALRNAVIETRVQDESGEWHASRRFAFPFQATPLNRQAA